jgi:hypothetical protein
MKNCFLPALAAVVMLASCQKDGTQTPVETGAKKSVTVTITNIAGPVTRAVQDDFTPAGVPVAKLTDLNVLFADADGEVVETRALGAATSTTDDVPTTIIDPDGTGTSYEYTFHQIPDTATKLVVTNLDVDDLDDLDTTLNAAQLLDWQVAPGTAKSIPVWGTNSQWVANGTDTVDGYPLYDAGTVDVAPKLARIEIGNIQCLNLAGQSAGANGMYPRFGSLDLAYIGIHNTKLGTIGGSTFSYTSDDDLATGLPKWNTDATAPTWNINSVSGVTLSSGAANTEKFFGFNVAPGAVPNIILEISSATENVVSGITIPGDVDPDDHYYVKTKSLMDGAAAISEFKPGYIYRVNFKFNSENVLPWDEEEEFVCVDVTVVIPDWVIYDEEPLTPGFN